MSTELKRSIQKESPFHINYYNRLSELKKNLGEINHPEHRSITVDSADTIFPEDGQWLELFEDGSKRASVLFAAPSHLISHGSSTFLAIEDMWTNNAKSDFVSLFAFNKNEPKPAFTVSVPIDADGNIKDPTIKKSRAKVLQRFDEDELAKALTNKQNPLHPFIEEYERAGLQLRKNMDSNFATKSAERQKIGFVADMNTYVNLALSKLLFENGIPYFYTSHIDSDNIDKHIGLGEVRAVIKSKVDIKKIKITSVASGHEDEAPYGGFTSPLRRYSHFLNNFILDSFLNGDPAQSARNMKIHVQGQNTRNVLRASNQKRESKR